MNSGKDSTDAVSSITRPVSGWFTLAVLTIIGFGMYWYVADTGVSNTEQASTTTDAQIISALDHLGKIISTAAQDLDVQYVRSYRVEGVDPPAYQSIYRTSSPRLLSQPNGNTDPVSFQVNSRRTEVWQKMFCGSWMADLVRSHGLVVISGKLEDKQSETQSLAVCSSR